MRFLLCLLLVSLSEFAQTDVALQTNLVEMARADQSIRDEVGQHGWDKAPQTLLEKMATIDSENTRKLKLLLDDRAWFTETEVGEIGVAAAFLLIQHSPDYAFQEKMLPELKASYLNHEGVTGQDVALLTDRVLVHKGENQLYGTQADIVNGEVTFMPIQEPDTVDERRAEMALPPLSFYKKLMEEMYGNKDHPDIDQD